MKGKCELCDKEVAFKEVAFKGLCLSHYDKSVYDPVKKRNYYLKHKSRINARTKAYNKEYYRRNSDSIIARTASNHLLKYKTDPKHRLKVLLRERLKAALRFNYKSGVWRKYLGCDLSTLKVFLEAKFLPGMTWENHGKWHIDHKQPLASFDLTQENQALLACHYTNLQPLWADANRSKGAKL